MSQFSRFDQSEKNQIMRNILTRSGVLLDIEEEEVADWEINYDDCKLYVRNLVDEDGVLSAIPSLVYQVNTYDGRIFEVEIRKIHPDDHFLDLYSDAVGQLELWW